MSNKKLWTFEYEPKDINDMILAPDKRKELQKIITELPNVLITGKPGTGKGTFMNILLRENHQCNCLKINASMENSIDDVREKIRNFATGYDPSHMKIVYLNECLDEDEHIKTPSGSIRIGDMEYDKKYDVLSYDIDNNVVCNDIAEKVSDSIDDIYEVEFDDGRTIKCNMNHKFFVEDDNGNIVDVKLSELSVGDDIYTIDKLKIKSIRQVKRERVIDVNVEKNSNFITSNGILTHNCDRISIPGQDAMRQLIEDTQDITRFFLIANDESKITDALVSRCGYQLSLNNPPGKDILKYCFNILKKENVTIKNKKAVVKLITKCYPDIRKIIGTLQSNVRDGVIDDISFNSAEDVYEKIVVSMKSMDLEGIRKELRSSYIDYDELYRYIYEKVMSDEDYFSSPGVMIHTIGEFLYKNKDMAIREVNFMTFVLDCAFKEAI